MTVQERERYDSWLRAHHPDPEKRRRLRQNREARKLLADVLWDEPTGGVFE